MTTLSQCRGAGLALATWGLMISAAWAVPPPNDDCSNATQVLDGMPINGTTVMATGADISSCAPGDLNDVWFVFSAPFDGRATFSLCGGAAFDTTLSVFESCGGPELACDDNTCDPQSTVVRLVAGGSDYLVRVAGSGGTEGPFTLSVAMDQGDIGPDVVYSGIVSISTYTAQAGIRAYTLGSFTCNVGDVDLPWGASSPLLAMNAYRLHDGRLEQIGMSWLKNGVGASAFDSCGLACNFHDGTVLGAGCLDAYSSSFNGGQLILGPRSQCNAFTGAYPGPSGGAGNSIFKRLQAAESDLDTDNFPGALYFVEGVYVAAADAGAGNAMNNASYQRVLVNQTSFALSVTGTFNTIVPAIFAWRDHGLGANTPDPNIDIVAADVPGEGRFHVAQRAQDLGGGNWRYSYAVYNLNSHRSGGAFTVPVPPGASVANVGFHDVNYHSGEPFDNTDWSAVVNPADVTWSSPQSFGDNPNSNALRFATMYTFWFDADVPPGPGDVTIGLFRPGTPDSVNAAMAVPGGCPGDCRHDGLLNGDDIGAFIACLLDTGCGCSDMNDDDATDTIDVGLFAAALTAGDICP